jgi:hypothetical protein
MFGKLTQRIADFLSAALPPRPELVAGEIKDVATQTTYKTSDKIAGLIEFEYSDITPSVSPGGMPILGSVVWRLTLRDADGVDRNIPLYGEERDLLLASFEKQIATGGIVTEIPGVIAGDKTAPDNRRNTAGA